MSLKHNPFLGLFDELKKKAMEAAEDAGAELVQEVSTRTLQAVIETGDKLFNSKPVNKIQPGVKITVLPKKESQRGLPRRKR